MKIKKQKGTKKCVIKTKLKFENYKNCLKYCLELLIIKEKYNNTALSSNDDKRLQSFDSIEKI